MISLNIGLAILSAAIAWATRRSSGLAGQAAIWALCVIAAIPVAIVLASILLGGPHGVGDGPAEEFSYVAMWFLLALALSVVIAGAMWFVGWRQGAAARLVVGLWATAVFGLTASWARNSNSLGWVAPVFLGWDLTNWLNR